MSCLNYALLPEMIFYAIMVYHNTPMKRQLIYVIEDYAFI